MSSGRSVFDALGLIADFDDALLEATSRETALEPGERRQMFSQHLQKMDKLNFIIPDFKRDLDWLNVSEPLSMEDKLKGCIVVLDFFTYCCINCMHILPDLEVLEEQHPPDSGIVVVGVHSAKFLNEKVTANILSAILRYGIHHPIVNDDDASLWQALSISCWPTLLFIGPSGQMLYSVAGEGHLNRILEFVEIAKDHYRNLDLLKPQPLPLSLELNKRQQSALSFPGKVSFWKENGWLVISDSGHNRIVISDVSGVVQEVIGSGSRGFKDGDFSEATFSSPQGVACWQHYIFVADTENHAVRRVDLSKRTVTTLCGNGKQGNDKEGGKIGTEQGISSPWDLVLGHSPHNKDSSDPDVLFIAMAGTHQIWAYFLKDASWYKNRNYSEAMCVRFAGSGNEENRNNSYPEKASFAQPSGLALCPSRNALYIADSESSSIRSISLKDGKVSAVAGGERDPMNLFAFGDADGKGINAKLQHPLGLAVKNSEGLLFVADSYNHKIKMVNLESQECITLVGTGKPGNELNQTDLTLCQLSEPGGLACGDESDGVIYVADTNNNAIKIIDSGLKSMSELPIIFPKTEKNSSIDHANDKNSMNDDKVESLPDVFVPMHARELSLTVDVPIPKGHHFNTEAPNRFKIEPLEDSETFSKLITPMHRKGKILIPKLSDETLGKAGIKIILTDQIVEGSHTFKLCIQYFLCLDEGNVCLPPKSCYFRQVVHLQS